MLIIDDSFVEVNSESSSRGNQRKFFKDDYWIKLDTDKCYEGLAEEFATVFADCILDFPHVQYKTEVINYKDEEYLGCYFKNMLSPITEFISLRMLFKKNNVPLKLLLVKDNVQESIRNVINLVNALIGVDISEYMNKILYFDALILNEDRQLLNLGVRYTQGQYMQAPCFDNGESLFCVDTTYRKKNTLDENLRAVKEIVNPFGASYDDTVRALQSLGGTPLQIQYDKLQEVLRNYTNPYYSQEQQSFIKQVLTCRLDYYKEKGVYYYV